MITNDRGSALITVLVVLFILLTAFFAVFSFALSRAGIMNNKINNIRAHYLADAGINRLLYTANIDSLEWTEIIDLTINENISATEKFMVKSSLAGGYILVASTGTASGKQVTKNVLIGIMPWPDLNSAVVNCSNTYPLVVSGKTKIYGDAIVGPEPVTKGSIEGETYYGDKLIYGQIILREKVDCQEIDHNPVRQYIDQLIDKKTSPDSYIIGSAVLRDFTDYKSDVSSVIYVEDNLEIKSLQLDSYKSAITIIAGGDIDIKGDCRINGLVEIAAGGSITVDSNSYLEGTTLIAEDSVIFQDAAVFCGQAMSGGRVIVGESAQIRYPSMLYVYCSDDDDDNTIVFDNGSRSQTIAIIAGDITPYSEKMHRLFIDSGAVTAGLMFCDQYSDIRGTLYGVSSTKNYYYRKDPTTYVNWLKDAVIDRNRLDFLPVMPVSFSERNKYAIFRILSEG